MAAHPALGYYAFLAFRAAAYDLPEDFVSRIEPGLDEGTKARLVAGVAILRRLRRVDRVMIGIALLGAVIVVSGIAIVGATEASSVGPLVLIAAALAWAASLGFLGFATLLSVRHRRELGSVLAFYRALQGSSLARDLA